MAQNTPPHGPPTLTVKGRDLRLRTIGIAILAVLAVWFIAANTGSVSIKLWVTSVTLPLWAVLAVTLLVGMVIGLFAGRRRPRS